MCPVCHLQVPEAWDGGSGALWCHWNQTSSTEGQGGQGEPAWLSVSNATDTSVPLATDRAAYSQSHLAAQQSKQTTKWLTPLCTCMHETRKAINYKAGLCDCLFWHSCVFQLD